LPIAEPEIENFSSAKSETTRQVALKKVSPPQNRQTVINEARTTDKSPYDSSIIPRARFNFGVEETPEKTPASPIMPKKILEMPKIREERPETVKPIPVPEKTPEVRPEIIKTGTFEINTYIMKF